AGLNVLDRLADGLRHLRLIWYSFLLPFRAGSEQHDAATDVIGEMVLDGAVDVRGRRCGRKLARKGIKIGDLAFAPARELGLALHVVGEMAHDHRNGHEQSGADDLKRTADIVQVVREIEEISGCNDPSDRL